MSFTPNAGTSPHTEWFNANILEPGQPGVFQVATEELSTRAAMLSNWTDERWAYSYFNGKVFGPLRNTAARAFDDRLLYNGFPGTITHFRGLSFDPSTL